MLHLVCMSQIHLMEVSSQYPVQAYRLPLNNKTGHVVTPESSCRTVYSIYHAALANALRRELFHELVQLCPGLTPQAV